MRPAVGLSSPAIMRIVVVLPAPFGPRKPWISPGWHLEADAVDGGERAVRLDEIVDGDHRRRRRGPRPAAAAGASRQRDRERRGASAAAAPTRIGVEPGASSRSRTVIFRRPISGRIAACLSRPPRARRRCVASAGNWLSVGSTGSHSRGRCLRRGTPRARRGSRTRRARTRGRRRCAPGCPSARAIAT